MDKEPSSYNNLDGIASFAMVVSVLVIVGGGLTILSGFASLGQPSGPGGYGIAMGFAFVVAGISMCVPWLAAFVFLDMARQIRSQTGLLEQCVSHLAEINPIEQEREAEQAAREEDRRQQAAAKSAQEADARQAEQARLEAQRQAEQARLEAERAQKLAEEQRLREAEDRTVDNIRRAAFSKFNEILQAARQARQTGVETDAEAVCKQIDDLFDWLAIQDSTPVFRARKIKLTGEVSAEFARHKTFEALKIKLKPA